VSTTATVLLGFIAAATVVMAAIQVGLVIVAARLGRKVEALTGRLEQDIRPLIANVSAVSENAQKMTALTVVQLERADRLFADVTQRVEDTTALIQGTITAPAREGRALMAGIAAAIGALREGAPSGRDRASRETADEEDPLFIG
jgi:hypothetical protein